MYMNKTGYIIMGIVVVSMIVQGVVNERISEIHVGPNVSKYLPKDLLLTECIVISNDTCRVEDMNSPGGDMAIVSVTVPWYPGMPESEIDAYVDERWPQQAVDYAEREYNKTLPLPPTPKSNSEKRDIKIKSNIYFCESRAEGEQDKYCYSLSPSTITCYTEPDKKGGKRCTEGWKEI